MYKSNFRFCAIATKETDVLKTDCNTLSIEKRQKVCYDRRDKRKSFDPF